MWLCILVVSVLAVPSQSWSFFGGYDDPCTVCECDDREHNLHINCNDKELSYLPLQEHWLPSNPNKTIIMNLNNNNIRRIGRFPELRITELYLQNNGMEEIEDQAFERLAYIRKLDLSRNELTAEALNKESFQGPFTTREWEQLPVEELNLSYNNIHSLDKDAFDHLEHVRILRMDNNPLREIDHATAIALVTLRKLEILSLAGCELVSVPDGVLNTFINLTEVNLSSNELTEVPPKLQTTYQVRRLVLNNNPITYLDEDSFEGLTSLKELSLSDMPELKKVDKYTFTPLKNLRKLQLSFCEKLEDIHPKAFDDLRENLAEVSLRGNALKTLSSDLLVWENLRVIDIQDNPWLCDCRMRWCATSLIAMIDKKTPELILSINCQYPPSLAGRSMAIVGENEKQMKCDKNYDGSYVKVETHHGGAIAAVVVIGLLFGTVGLVTVLAVLAKRKKTATASTSRQIKYQRAPEDEGKAQISSSYLA